MSPLDVGCTYCRAKIGEPCTLDLAGGEPEPVDLFHLDRTALFREAHTAACEDCAALVGSACQMRIEVEQGVVPRVFEIMALRWVDRHRSGRGPDEVFSLGRMLVEAMIMGRFAVERELRALGIERATDANTTWCTSGGISMCECGYVGEKHSADCPCHVEADSGSYPDQSEENDAGAKEGT